MNENTRKIAGGCILLARQTMDSEIFLDKPHVWFKIWLYFLLKVNYQDNQRFKRGQNFMKYEWIMSSTGATKNQVKHCIEWLKSRHMIATQKATRGMIVTIINYSTYQTLDNYKSHTESQDEGTRKEHESHTILKKDKKGKKKEYKYIPQDLKDAEFLLQLIRQHTPDYQPGSPIEKWADDVRLLRERDGYSHDVIKAVFQYAHTRQDDFWYHNALSPAGFRTKSKSDGVVKFQRIKMQMNRKGTNGQETNKISREFTADSQIGETIEAQDLR